MGTWSSSAEASVATNGASNIAAGLGNHLPIGDYSGADYRSAVRFPVPAGWNAWTSITSAALSFWISDHQHVAPKSSSIYVSRMNITAPIWSKGAGSQSCESGFSGGNNTQYDDLTSTPTDRTSFSSGSTANVKKSIDVTAMMRYYWGNGANNSKPVFVFDNNGSGQYTELWSAQKTGGYDLILTINYTDQEPPTAPTINSPDGGTVVVSQTPTLNFIPHDPQGDVHTEYHYQVAADAGFAGLVEDLVVSGSFPDNTAISRTMVNAQTRGATRYWRVQTRDAAVGYGPWSPTASFVIKDNPVVNIDATRYMDFNGAPRLRVKWGVTGGTQVSYRVTGPSGYTSGIINNGNQDHLLDTLAISDNVAASITVEVWTSDGLYNYANRSFTPRYGLTVHRRDLGAAPLNWGGSSEQKTVPAGCQLIIEYGSDAASVAAPGSGWQASLGSVPKQRYVFWRAWFIPSATQGPTLDRITITSDATAGKTVDKWYRYPNVPFSAPWALDESEYVYGTRSVRVDNTGADSYLRSEPISVKPGRSYILTGLMKSKGDSSAQFYLADAAWGQLRAEDGALIESAKLRADTPWFSETSQDVNRYKTPIWVATTDTVIVVLTGVGAVGTQAWFDALKLEESTVATPWSPASIGATVIDAGGVQIDGNKGGILRYKGTDGLARSVVEGGPKGLVFGGDTELSSPAAQTLRIGPGSGNDWALQIGDDLTLYDAGIANTLGLKGIQDPASAQLAFGSAKDTTLYRSGGNTLRTGALEVGELRPATNIWHRSWPDYYNRFHFAQGGRSYYGSAGGHEFRNSADAALLLLGDNGWLRYGGTSWPGGASTGDLFYRTDYGMWFVWDNQYTGRWVSAQVFTTDFGDVSNISATQTDVLRHGVALMPGMDYIFVEDFSVSGFIVNTGGTALQAGHRWDISLRMFAGGSSAQVGGALYSINSGASGAWRTGGSVAVNSSVALSNAIMWTLNNTKVGTPGNLYAYPAFTWRYVAT